MYFIYTNAKSIFTYNHLKPRNALVTLKAKDVFSIISHLTTPTVHGRDSYLVTHTAHKLNA